MKTSIPPERLSTGVPGLDVITRGGLIQGGIYLVTGRAGAGKSVLGHQIAFGHVGRGGRAVYATLSATHTRMLAHVTQLSFFDENAVGKGLLYLDAPAASEAGGVDGLLQSVEKTVREHSAGLLILDGQLGALSYEKLVAALQTSSGVVGCTVVVLRTDATEGAASAAQPMVDGIVELGVATRAMCSLRYLAVVKLRGSGFAEGRHSYTIDANGLQVFPRTEATLLTEESKEQPLTERVSTGTPGLDLLVGGALVRGSTTLLLGSAGAGKTIAGLQFLVDGARAGERVLHFGFYEPPHALVAKAKRLAMNVSGLIERGNFHVAWRDPSEVLLDRTIHELTELVREKSIQRVVIDGLAGLRTSDCPERIARAFAAFTNHLSRLGVTTVVTDETRELFVRDVEVPTQNVSALFHNILFFRQVELHAQLLRLVGVIKTRDSGHDRRLWELEISDTGMRVLRPFQTGDRGLMGGGEGEPAMRERENTTRG